MTKENWLNGGASSTEMPDGDDNVARIAAQALTGFRQLKHQATTAKSARTEAKAEAADGEEPSS
ncbi:hypothetical protein [Chitiniphilus eburneus]|uniref:Uncharacterized protein n=1 Tax=Chitiniphilus eburneus TaxID=2571148 RepID=A0A4U0PDE9_9NEIS|nr:hypothetical protein [Chitiniphilus eburneus]TJZ65619.1 hypothetical protein FAZ21_17960 [Chitiniphilus eburneus]